MKCLGIEAKQIEAQHRVLHRQGRIGGSQQAAMTVY